MKATKTLIAMLVGSLLAGPVLAQDRAAIIIGNRNFEQLREVPDANRAFMVSQDLRRQGFEVTTFRDMDAQDMRAAAAKISGIIDRASHVIVFISGHVAGNGHDAWFLPVDASLPHMMTPSQGGLSIAGLMDAMAENPGSAVLLIGKPERGFAVQPGVFAGIAGMDVPQGVTVFTGDTDDLVDLAADALLRPGTSYADVAARAGRSVAAMGYLGTNGGLLQAEAQGSADVSSAELEAFRFAQARDAGTVAALTSFLSQYPNGAYADQANALLADLQKTPEERARDAETALGLTRTQRREIQGNLTLIGFDTNGVDGIFGRGSRAAIERWQRSVGDDATGYLTAAQIGKIDAQAQVERQRLEAADAAYWQQTGRLGTEAGYRAYLERYPEGIFGDLARGELKKIDDQRRASQAAAEAVAWQEASAVNTAQAYRAFLQDYPDGAHASDAIQRLEEIEAQNGASAEVEAAKAAEQKLLGNPITRILVERRLGQLGFNPGLIDGTFDKSTRLAVRQFQQSKDMAQTGYVDSRTLSALLNN